MHTPIAKAMKKKKVNTNEQEVYIDTIAVVSYKREVYHQIKRAMAK